MKRITLEIPEELHKEIKKLAFVEDRSISSVTREALEAFCAQKNAINIKIVDQRFDDK